MTDMRDFSSNAELRGESVFIDTGAASNDIPIRESYTLDDSGGLGEFHRPIDDSQEMSSRNKTLGALAVALMIGAAGAVVYTMYAPKADVVADESLPRTNAPRTAAVAPLTPPPPAADSAVGEAMATAPTDTEAGAPTSPQTAMSPPAAPEMPRATQPRVANAPAARIAAPSASVTAPVTAPAPATVAPPVMTPPQQAAAVPEPVSPTPPASAVAGNPPLNEQSAAPVEAAPVTPTEATPAEAAPAGPEAQPAPPLDQSQ